MTPAEARTLLDLPDGPAEPEVVRAAYLRRVRSASLTRDPAGFTRLRAAFEALRRGEGAQEDIEAARANLKAHPDSSDARWTLLSHLSYADGTEAFSVLRDGASRQGDAFLDELLFHFPGKIPPDLLAQASAGAAPSRLLLIADVHASQGRQAEALEWLKRALAESHDLSPALVRLAARPVLSLHGHAQIDAAGAALALLKSRASALAFDFQRLDMETSTMMAVADELGRLGPSFPLELRQVGALAAKNGDLEHARYEARYATRLLSGHAVRAWRKRLEREAPTLASLFALELTEEELRPRGIPNFKIPLGLGISILSCVVYLSLRIHLVKSTGIEVDQVTLSLFPMQKTSRVKTGLEACADPTSDDCLNWQSAEACAHLSPDDCERWTEAWIKKWRPGERHGP